ncbi:MAG TPA: hypothetical protein VKH37_08500, partial [Ferruginibacter sp.]|nr:hypothetical protein [Ferruginibacter sp.]
HFLKQQFHNWFTGKLSDAAGIIMLPLLLAFLFPRLRTNAVWISAIIFVVWKSPLSQLMIDTYDQFALIPITRIVDYSDLFVFVLLPVPYMMIKGSERFATSTGGNHRPVILLVPTIFILMATSPPRNSVYVGSYGKLTCYHCGIAIHKTQKDILGELKNAGVVFDNVSEENYALADHVGNFYRIDRLIVGKDTLKKISLMMSTSPDNMTNVSLTAMEVPPIPDHNRRTRKLGQHYRDLFYNFLKETLKD